MRSPPSALAALALGVLLSAPAAALHAVGEAYAPGGGELRYREHHHCDAAATRCTVEYRDPRGAVFARKWLDYSASPSAPRLRFEDRRSGLELASGGEVATGVVVDAGFDNYVRLRWEDLAAGKSVSFRFLPAGGGQPQPLVARRDAGKPCTAGQLCLRVEPGNWLLALFAGAIELVYDRQSRRLLRFRGPSNIRDARGASQQVEIDYRYPPAGS